MNIIHISHDLYNCVDCPEDFTLGLLWERSLTKTTYRHKCSDIHPSFKFADSVTRDCLKNRTWAPVNITQCVMDSDSPVVMIVIINLATDNSSLVKLREEIIIEEVSLINQLCAWFFDFTLFPKTECVLPPLRLLIVTGVK